MAFHFRPIQQRIREYYYYSSTTLSLSLSPISASLSRMYRSKYPLFWYKYKYCTSPFAVFCTWYCRVQVLKLLPGTPDSVQHTVQTWCNVPGAGSSIRSTSQRGEQSESGIGFCFSGAVFSTATRYKYTYS